ncbi:MAG: hypothetical protein SFW67_10005 [Myxococcaceae bacterium]|nr:hypothetical protein [Myxococcaceae bacterium]
MRFLPVFVVLAGVVACEPPRMVCDNNRLGENPELCLGLTTEQGQGRLVRTAFVGSKPIDSVSISNRGLRPLELRAVSFAGPREFKVKVSWAMDAELSAAPATTIMGGQRVFVQVEFAPTRVGTFEGKVTLESNAANQPTASFDVKGCAVPPGDDGTAPMPCE